MDCRAVWIIDQHFLLPGYLSIKSFLAHHDIPISIIYCGGDREEEAKAIFLQLDSSISFSTFSINIPMEHFEEKGTILNRLARTEVVMKSTDEILLLFDADLHFTKSSVELIEFIKSTHVEDQPTIWGYPEIERTYNSYLYFRVQDKNDRFIKLSDLQKHDCYSEVYGAEWMQLLGGDGMNNGVLAFYKCKAVAEKWSNYYLKGLEHKVVNPADDQLPLVAAIETTAVKTIFLDEKFNFLGEVSGDYAIFHALSGVWEMQFLSIINQAPILSDFAKIGRQYWKTAPKQWIEEFLDRDIKISPFHFLELSGSVGCRYLYEDVIDGIDQEGHFVELGTYSGKTACLMAELIKISGKKIQFDSLDCYPCTEVYNKKFQSLLEQTELAQFVQVIKNQEIWLQHYQKKSLDFVFIHGDATYKTLLENLEQCLPLVKDGGVIGGYDFAAKNGLQFGYKSAIYDFCEKRGLSVRIDFNIFIIVLNAAKPLL